MPSSSLLASLLKKASYFLRFRPFSSITSATHKRWSYFSDDLEAESSVYNHALKFQRPSTIKYGQNGSFRTQNKQLPVNSVSFIGTIHRELRRIKTHDGLGVHTLLKVKASPQSNCSFLVLLKMWEEMAEMSINHLKPNDFVYVWGHLGSYVKADENGELRTNYEVIVKEINYVAQSAEKSKYQESKRLRLQDEDYTERCRNRLHLWQIFFSNPYEWIDFRKTKTNPRHPDFKNMSTGEVLWLSDKDPPWIKRQLQLLDSGSREQSLGGRRISSTSCTSLLVDDSV